MSASAGPSTESAPPSEPKDYWKHLRAISEFHEVWRLLDDDYRNSLTGEGIRKIFLEHSPHLTASVKHNKKYLNRPDFPRELALFHEGLRLPATMIDSGHRYPTVHTTYWPDGTLNAEFLKFFLFSHVFSRSTPVGSLPALFQVPMSPAKLKQLAENAEREERNARRNQALAALAKAKRDAETARKLAADLESSSEDEPLQRGKRIKRKPSASPVGSAKPEVKRPRDEKVKSEKSKAAPDANPATASASRSKAKAKTPKGPSKVSIPATDGTDVEVLLLGRQAGPVKDSSDRVLHDGGVSWENARKTAISHGQALPIIVRPTHEMSPVKLFSRLHCEEVYQRRQGKPTNKKNLTEILSLLPVAEREQIPTDEMGNKIVDHETIYRVMKIRPPTNGPKCIPCQRQGSQCFTAGFPLGCEACTRTHSAGGCNLSLSGEVQDHLAAQLTSYVYSGSEHWHTEIEALNRSQQILESMSLAFVQQQSEHNYRCLKLLQHILCARRDLPENQFVERFADRLDMEHTLLLALIQGLTCRTKITRLYVWHYYTGEFFEKPLPEFGSAYEFYQALDNAGAAIPGYFLLPPETSDGQAKWVPLKVEDLSYSGPPGEGADLGPNTSKIRRRLRREDSIQKGEPLPEESDNESPESDDGKLPEPPVPAQGLLRRVIMGGLDPYDLQAIESSEARIEFEERMASEDEEDDFEEQDAEDIDDSQA
ncbi:hypothetical protein C8F04DRAFT_1199164, partial [Mycena alexandri]